MARCIAFFLAAMCLVSVITAADWNIMNQRMKSTKSSLEITLKNYCESWRMNVELNNIKDFTVVPSECTSYIGKYMGGTQFTVDAEATIHECTLYLNTLCDLKKDGKDAWIFDIDDTLLSTVPYYKKHGYGGETLNVTGLEEWMTKGKGTAMGSSLTLFNDIKNRGIQIILISSRKEHLRSATIDNLVDAGFYGWKSLYLRSDEDGFKTVQQYKASVRSELINNGYRLWGILGDQWSSIRGLPTARRTFKLPNSLYYVA
ncbi:HAD superfamily, subfamily IIIB acid phosphatase [Artemisia annua]|uniref:HAD superfamily, subfamily IIIB acid phosphatase n=1 Tax=Artemisia annua TaxID=35608 RepID=A0A2U1P452_ARTAN|nr:HAD superfamily, subfamily IIIB acid phosphatase [Artemisia annua]